MNDNLNVNNKQVYIGDQPVVLDWKNIKVLSQEDFQEKVEVNELAKKVVQEQKKVVPTSNNIILSQG